MVEGISDDGQIRIIGRMRSEMGKQILRYT